jgi:hypothetical protein
VAVRLSPKTKELIEKSLFPPKPKEPNPVDLTTQAVRDILTACQGEEGDLKVEGICGYFLFNREKLEEHRQQIIDLLYGLPSSFQIARGGMSFLQACYDRHGNHWAEHPTMDALFCLGIGIDMVGYNLPRETWHILPGGMPYLYIKDPNENPEQGS